MMRTLSFIDRLLGELDTTLRTLIPPQNRTPNRESPANNVSETTLSADQRKHIAGLMRVNHAGEVCAQALYQGQALTAHLTHIKKQMNEAAAEEVDHLAWCEERLYQLGSRPSLLNPLWYSGSLLIGAAAGLAGDKISLGFVAETERQVSAHLQQHLQKIPAHDNKTIAILDRMHSDEEYHAATAVASGAVELPRPIKGLMKHVAKVMTRSSYYL